MQANKSKQITLEDAQVNTTTHGIDTITNLNSVFGGSTFLPCEVVGSKARVQRDELGLPFYSMYMESIKNFSKYLKRVATGIQPKDYVLRVHHLDAAKRLFSIAATMNFSHSFDRIATEFMTHEVTNLQNVKGKPWGMLDVIHGKELSETKVVLRYKDGVEELDLSGNGICVQVADWNGRVKDIYELIDASTTRKNIEVMPDPDDPSKAAVDENNKPIYIETKLPINLALRIREDSIGNAEVNKEAERIHGAINRSDLRKTFLSSPLDYPFMRIITLDEDGFDILDYSPIETDELTNCDFCYDISFQEYSEMIDLCNKWKKEGIYCNSREFAMLNLFRWGILSRKNWDACRKVIAAVDKSPATVTDAISQVDAKIITWGMTWVNRMREIELKKDKNDYTRRDPEDITDNIIVSGSQISDVASMQYLSLMIVNVLVITNVTDDDIDFVSTKVAFASKRKHTRVFNAVSRLNTSDYKFVEIDVNNNPIAIIPSANILAFVNHDIQARLILTDDDGKGSNSDIDFYNAITSFGEEKPVPIVSHSIVAPTSVQ